MTYPAYSYLSPATLGLALDLARVLFAASEDVGTLGFGPAGTASLDSGRAGNRLLAAREWIGPHRDTFDQLMDNELDSARTTRLRLAAEADAWSRFWAQAMNARNSRLHDEAMVAFGQGMEAYTEQAGAYDEAIDQDPELAMHLSVPTPPQSPLRPPYVVAPTSATNYHPG